LKSGLEHQIFWRVAGDEKFRKQDRIGFGVSRLGARRTRQSEIAFNIPQNGVQLGQSKAETGGRSGHGLRLTDPITLGNGDHLIARCRKSVR
jgi:hypothetical protein